jgi:hypothetical protein
MLKLVLFFNQYQAGWSETYYADGSDPRAFALTITERFMQNAVNMRNAATFLKAIRVTRIEKPRSSYLVRPKSPKQGMIVGNTLFATNGPDVPSTDAVILLQGQNAATRRIFLRGLNDVDITRDAFGNDLLSTGLNAGVTLFVKGMIAYGFKIRYMERPPNSGLAWQTVSRLSKDTTNDYNAEVKFIVDPVLAVGDTISFNGVPGNLLPRFPRNALILGKIIVGGVITYVVPYALPGGRAVEPKKMQGTRLLYQWSSIEDWAFERYSEHKTGRPFGSLRGRSRAVGVVR